MLNIDQAIEKVKRLYANLGWPTIFTHIRFFTAPFRRLESLVPKTGLIIDLGCGYGIFSNLLALSSNQRQVIGIDLDEGKIKYADRGLANVEFHCENINQSKLDKADCILLVHVLHHLTSHAEQGNLVEACYKKLKLGGKLIVCEIHNRPRWKYLLTQLADHLLYSRDTIYYRWQEDWVKFFQEFGFQVEALTMHQGKPFSHISFVCTKK